MIVRQIKLINRRVVISRNLDGNYYIIFKRLLDNDETPKESDNLKINGRVQTISFSISEEGTKALCSLLIEEIRTNELLKIIKQKN
jgi:hypothetical protein